MSGVFHDTLFAFFIRAFLGPKYFSHLDEIDYYANIYQRSNKKKVSSESVLERGIEDYEDPLKGSTRDASGSSAILSYRVVEGGLPKPVEEGSEPLLVTWHGPDDPENPMNWSHLKKSWVVFQVCLLTFTVYIGSAIYTAGIIEVMQEFHVSSVAATLCLTLFVAGYGIGPMLWSPMSEMPYIGRMPIYLVTLFLFVVFQVSTALATNFGMLMAFRFITGFVGSPVLATGGATVADMYVPKKRAYGSPSGVPSQWLLLLWAPLSAAFLGTQKAGDGRYGKQLLGLAFLGILGGILVTLPPFFYYLYTVQEKMFDEDGQIKPEKRMIIAIFGSFFLLASILWFGWTARPTFIGSCQ
ncbi:major facilitator superfamily domain-containing protein [Lactifluus volemus]|nr:major facilitator superfamily domain-containing protein [Lactifluus volemus]